MNRIKESEKNTFTQSLSLIATMAMYKGFFENNILHQHVVLQQGTFLSIETHRQLLPCW